MNTQDSLFDLPAKVSKPRSAYVQDIRIQVVRECEATEAQAHCNRPEAIAAFWREHIVNSSWFDAEKEMFVVLNLNRKNRVRSFNLVTLGTATSSLTHPREVFRPAIVAGATAIVCMHNHPSGDPAPSMADVQVTRQLREAAKAVDIDLLDHVIIGSVADDPMGQGFYSFRNAGHL